MRYFKVVADGTILGIGTGQGGIEISKDEFDTIDEMVKHQPEPSPGCGLSLGEDLVWHEYQIPPSTEGQATASEADYLAALERFGVK